MKKNLKKLLALCMTIVMCSMSGFVAYANAQTNSSNFVVSINVDKYNHMDDEELKNELRRMGLPKETVDELMAIKEKIEANPELYSARLREFPSNPEIGDTYTIEYTLSQEEITTTQFIIETLVALGAPVAAAITIGGLAMAFLLQHPNSKGLLITVEYYYGYNNDGFLAWNPRQVEFSDIPQEKAYE